LEGLFFDFSKTGFLTTNLMGNEQTIACKLENNTIQQLGDNPITYNIVQINDQKMVLEMKMNETPFRFNLEKKPIEEQK